LSDKPAELSRSDEIAGRNARKKIEVIGAVQQVRNALLRLLIRNMRCAHAGLQLEHFAREMRRRAEACGREIEPARLFLQNRNQVVGEMRNADCRSSYCFEARLPLVSLVAVPSSSAIFRLVQSSTLADHACHSG